MVDECDKCANFYIIDKIRCCELKPLIKMFDGITSLRYLDTNIKCCENYEEVNISKRKDKI